MRIKETSEGCPLTLAVFAYYDCGNERLLEPVFKSLDGRLKGYCWSLGIRDVHQTEEIVQLTQIDLLDTFRKRTYAPPVSPGGKPTGGMILTWAYRLLSFRVADSKRKYIKAPSSPSAYEDPFLLVGDAAADAVDEPEHPMHKQEAADAIKAVTRAVLTLPERQRKVIILLFYQGMKVKEVSKLVGIDQANLYRYCTKKALDNLRASLSATGIKSSAELYSALATVDTGDLFKEELKAPTVHEMRYTKRYQWGLEDKATLPLAPSSREAA